VTAPAFLAASLKVQPMSAKTIVIAGPRGLRIPASVFGKSAPGTPDKVVPPHEPIEVPEAYGRHLIDDRFAVEVEPEGKKSKGAKPSKEEKPSDPPKDLTKLSRDELIKLATEKGLAVQLDMDEAAIIALLQKQQ